MTELQYRIADGTPAGGAELEAAFRTFSEVSERLQHSYQSLQEHVVHLQAELDSTSREVELVSEDRHALEGRFDGLLELLPGGVVVLDQHGCIERCNPAAESFLGPDLDGRSWSEVIEERFAPRSDDGHEVSLHDGRRLSIGTGSLQAGRGQIVLLTDQTETRALQDRLARHERLTTMGKMVAYLAHQIRTPLSSAVLYASHLGQAGLDESHRTEFSSKLMKQLFNLEKQISDLLIFARGRSNHEKDCTVAEILGRLQRAIDLSPLLAQEDIVIQDDVEGAVIRCHPEAFTGALVNLLVNSVEAFYEQPDPIPDDLMVVVSARMHGNMLNLAVEDNGPGIEAAERSRMLEPFRTTKAKGTGLGLAVVQALVESLDGSVSLEGNAAGGLCVRLRMPVVDQQPRRTPGREVA